MRVSEGKKMVVASIVGATGRLHVLNADYYQPPVRFVNDLLPRSQ